MGKRYSDLEQHFGVKVEFSHEHEEYVWTGDYEVKYWGELSDMDYPGDSELEVSLIDTDSLIKWDNDQESWVEVELTRSIQVSIENEIERGL